MDFGELIDESAENAGIDPSSITARHINSIRRSIEMLQIELETEGATAEFREHTVTIRAPVGAAAISLPDDAIDVTVVSTKVVSTSSGDMPLTRISRDTWTVLPDKYTTGAPTSYWVSKSEDHDDLVTAKHTQSIAAGFGLGGWGAGPWGGTGTVTPNLPTGIPVLVLYPAVEVIRDITLTYYRHHRAPGHLGDTVDAARNWLPTFSTGLSAKIAKKWNKPAYPGLKAEYDTMLALRTADENNHDVRIGFRGHGWARRHRHYGGR